MQQAGPVRIYGKRGCPAAYAIRDYLQRSDIPFEWVELRDDEHARKELGVEDADDFRLPICILADGTRMERPTVRQITEKLGWFRNPSRSEYDLAIYGAGPAGLSASVYGSSEGLKTVLIERFAVGGQAGTSPKIVNYLGFPESISGAELAERAREQACKFGAEILLHRAGVRGEFLGQSPCGRGPSFCRYVGRARRAQLCLETRLPRALANDLPIGVKHKGTPAEASPDAVHLFTRASHPPPASFMLSGKQREERHGHDDHPP